MTSDDESGLFPPEPILVWKNIEILPVLHGVLETAAAVRGVMEDRDFAHLAVELPPSIRAPLLSAIGRLPAVSVIHYERKKDVRYFLVESTSGICEAVRTAREKRISIHLVDLDDEEPEEHRDVLPDPYATTRIGWKAYCEAYFANNRYPTEPSDRERCMAHHLQRLALTGEPVLCVCGLYHAKRIHGILDKPQPRPLGRVHRAHVGLSHLDGDCARETSSEPAYIREEYEEFRGISIDAISGAKPSGKPEVPEVSKDFFPWGPDRWVVLNRLLKRAARKYKEKNSMEVSAQSLETAMKFCRNWVLLEGRLSPELYHVVVAARGVADDDFAYHVWDTATGSPVQDVSYDLPVLKLSLEDLGKSGKLMRFRKRLKQRRRMLRVLRKKPREEFPGQWKNMWEPGGICSYPPEDLIVESFGSHLKSRVHRHMTEESVRVEPFEVSIGDGIDVRETIRNWHKERLYVKHKLPGRAKVGAVIVVFDHDDQGKERFPWKITWQGEHAQESDMAFYATPMGDRLVGPGIAKSEYGGFLMTYPPGRMFHVWEDPYFDYAQTKPERLILAALDYCMDDMIIYVDKYPPSRRYKRLAARFGKKLFYLPLGRISPSALKKTRFFHVLAGHDVRRYAEEFID